MSTYLLLVADPEEMRWSVYTQSDDPDEVMDAILDLDEQSDPSKRIGICIDDLTIRDLFKEEEGNG